MGARASVCALVLSSFGVLAGCATSKVPPSQAQITDDVTAEATVVGVNKETREVTLKDADGSHVIIVCGPEVRNFDRIEKGNKVRARYEITLTAKRLNPEDIGTPTVAAVAAGRAGAGEKPAGAIGAGAAMTVVVKTVDTKQHVVTFTDPSGELHAIEAQRDEGKRFVEGLKSGDRVEIVYTEALGLSVE